MVCGGLCLRGRLCLRGGVLLFLSTMEGGTLNVFVIKGQKKIFLKIRSKKIMKTLVKDFIFAERFWNNFLRKKKIRIKRNRRSEIVVVFSPKSHRLLPKKSSFSHKKTTKDSDEIRKVFGKKSNSVKKMSELSNKKMVKRGEKVKFPTSVMSEIGSPHAASIGNDTSVIKS